MAHLIVIILIILSGGILFNDQQINREETSLLDAQSMMQEVRLSSVQPAGNSQSVVSLIRSKVNIHAFALESGSVFNNVSFSMARVLETNYLIPEKDTKISLALRGPPRA